MRPRFGLDEHRHDAFADNGLRFEHLQREFSFCRGLVESQVLVRKGLYEIGRNLGGGRFVRTHMNFDIFRQRFAFEGKKVIEQTKEVLHGSLGIAGDVEGDPPLDETHLGATARELRTCDNYLFEYSTLSGSLRSANTSLIPASR